MSARVEQHGNWRDARARLGMEAPRPKPVVVPAPPAAPTRRLDPDAIALGHDAQGAIGIDLPKLLDGRLLIQGASGAGKSWTLRRLLEQSAGAVQQIIIDPEGEFASFAEAYGYLSIDAAVLDAGAIAASARRVREHRASVRYDLSDVEREGQMIAVANIFSALVDAPREQWQPALVLVDEAHLFAPYGGQADIVSSVRKASIGALVDLMSRGRKRGLCGVLATQRLARLSKSVVSEAHNFLIGLNTLDLDIRRAAETIGWTSRRAIDLLPSLSPGDFVAVGPAFSNSPTTVRVGPVETRHGGAAPKLTEAPILAPEDAGRLIDLDGLVEQSAGDQAIRDQAREYGSIRVMRAMIRDTGFAAAGRIYDALLPLHPSGARVADMPAALGLEEARFNAGLLLLDHSSALEFTGEGRDRVVRLAKGMRP